MRKRRSESGFTLIEVMIVVGIIGVIAYLAVPNLQEMVNRNKIGGEARTLYGKLLESSGEAVRRGKNRQFQFADDGTWSILEDTDEDGTFERTIDTGQLPTSICEFGPDSGWTESFTTPYASVPNGAWCSFCTGSDGDVTLSRDGTLLLESGATSGSLFISSTEAPDQKSYGVIFIGATGEIKLVARGRQ